MKAAVYGVGTTLFGKQPERTAGQLVATAVREAAADAGIDLTRIEAVYVGTVFGEAGAATRTLQQVGVVGVPIITIENACASGTTAYHEAA